MKLKEAVKLAKLLGSNAVAVDADRNLYGYTSVAAELGFNPTSGEWRTNRGSWVVDFTLLGTYTGNKAPETTLREVK